MFSQFLHSNFILRADVYSQPFFLLDISFEFVKGFKHIVDENKAPPLATIAPNNEIVLWIMYRLANQGSDYLAPVRL